MIQNSRETPETSGQRSVYIRLSLTDNCNLRCLYCNPQGCKIKEHALPLNNSEIIELLQIIDALIPIRKLRLTGGEPLLRVELIRLIARLRENLPNIELTLTTNGINLSQHAKSLKSAGLDRVNVSLDSPRRDRYRLITGADALCQVVEGIQALNSAGFAGTKINTVLLRTYNGDHLAELVELASSLGCEPRFIELMPIGPGQGLYSNEHLSAAEALEILKKNYPSVHPIGVQGTAMRYSLTNGKIIRNLGIIAAVSRPFCSTCDRLRLDSFGMLFTCLRQDNGESLAKELREGNREGLRHRIAAIIEAKKPMRQSWPDRRMAIIGG